MDNENKIPSEITEDELQQYLDKCNELAKTHNVSQVHCCVQVKRDDGSMERIVSYIKEPSYMTKLALMDKAAQVGIMMAGEEFRLLCQLKDESHRLTYIEHHEADKYKLGVTRFCVDIIELVQDELGKKKRSTPLAD